MAGMRELTDREVAILAFEAKYPRHTGAKEEAIRLTFKLRTPRYLQLLNRLIDDPAALAHDPQLVKRLLNAREQRTARRAAHTFA